MPRLARGFPLAATCQGIPTCRDFPGHSLSSSASDDDEHDDNTSSSLSDDETSSSSSSGTEGYLSHLQPTAAPCVAVTCFPLLTLSLPNSCTLHPLSCQGMRRHRWRCRRRRRHHRQRVLPRRPQRICRHCQHQGIRPPPPPAPLPPPPRQPVLMKRMQLRRRHMYSGICQSRLLVIRGAARQHEGPGASSCP